MKTTLKIVKIGNSKGIIIPSHITKRLKLDINDLVELDIKKINGNETKIKKKHLKKRSNNINSIPSVAKII